MEGKGDGEDNDDWSTVTLMVQPVSILSQQLHIKPIDHPSGKMITVLLLPWLEYDKLLALLKLWETCNFWQVRVRLSDLIVVELADIIVANGD